MPEKVAVAPTGTRAELAYPVARFPGPHPYRSFIHHRREAHRGARPHLRP
jgi:hypothetical protein